MPGTASGGFSMFRILTSASASTRLAAAQQFVLDASPATETLVVSASRGAADDFARNLSRARSGATFGLYRFSLTQLAARLAAPRLARDRVAPTTALGMQAVAARALFDAFTGGSLSYFAPVASMPGFPRALARTLEELALASVSPAALGPILHVGYDLANLFERFAEQFEAASTVDRAAFIRTAAQAAVEGGSALLHCRIVLLDVPIANDAEAELVAALVARSPDALATVPEGDARTLASLKSQVSSLKATENSEMRLETSDFRLETSDLPSGGLARIRHFLFSPTPPPAGEPLDEVELFSAPGEGRE